MKTTERCVLVDNEQVLKDTLKANERVVALFYASWCPFCKKFLPIFMRNAEGEGRDFLSVQDDGETLADKYSVKIFPTVLYFEKGIVLKRLDGIPGVGIQEQHLAEFVRTCP